jgi:hypothetical protein
MVVTAASRKPQAAGGSERLVMSDDYRLTTNKCEEDMTEDFDKYYEAVEPGRRERAYAWATAIGLQDVDGLKPSKYLVSTAKRHIEGEIS